MRFATNGRETWAQQCGQAGRLTPKETNREINMTDERQIGSNSSPSSPSNFGELCGVNKRREEPRCVCGGGDFERSGGTEVRTHPAE